MTVGDPLVDRIMAATAPPAASLPVAAASLPDEDLVARIMGATEPTLGEYVQAPFRAAASQFMGTVGAGVAAVGGLVDSEGLARVGGNIAASGPSIDPRLADNLLLTGAPGAIGSSVGGMASAAAGGVLGELVAGPPGAAAGALAGAGAFSVAAEGGGGILEALGRGEDFQTARGIGALTAPAGLLDVLPEASYAFRLMRRVPLLERAASKLGGLERLLTLPSRLGIPGSMTMTAAAEGGQEILQGAWEDYAQEVAGQIKTPEEARGLMQLANDEGLPAAVGAAITEGVVRWLTGRRGAAPERKAEEEGAPPAQPTVASPVEASGDPSSAPLTSDGVELPDKELAAARDRMHQVSHPMRGGQGDLTVPRGTSRPPPDLYEAAEPVRAAASRLGARVAEFDGGASYGIDGYYDSQTRTILINRNATPERQRRALFEHEMVHHLADTQSDVYKQLEEAIVAADPNWLDQASADREGRQRASTTSGLNTADASQRSRAARKQARDMGDTRVAESISTEGVLAGPQGPVLGPKLAREEAVAETIQGLTSIRDLVQNNRKLAVQIATYQPGLIRNLADTLIDFAHKVGLWDTPSVRARVRALDSALAEHGQRIKTPSGTRSLSAQASVRIMLKVAELEGSIVDATPVSQVRRNTAEVEPEFPVFDSDESFPRPEVVDLRKAAQSTRSQAQDEAKRAAEEEAATKFRGDVKRAAEAHLARMDETISRQPPGKRRRRLERDAAELRSALDQIRRQESLDASKGVGDVVRLPSGENGVVVSVSQDGASLRVHVRAPADADPDVTLGVPAQKVRTVASSSAELVARRGVTEPKVPSPPKSKPARKEKPAQATKEPEARLPVAPSEPAPSREATAAAPRVAPKRLPASAARAEEKLPLPFEAAAGGYAPGERIEATVPHRYDDRLKDPEVQAQLRHMAATEAGQNDVGGQRKRARTVGMGDEFGFGGKTNWAPKSEWWRNRPPGISNPRAVQRLVERAIAGKRLGPVQLELLGYMLDVAENERGRSSAPSVVDFLVGGYPLPVQQEVDVEREAIQNEGDAFEGEASDDVPFALPEPAALALLNDAGFDALHSPRFAIPKKVAVGERDEFGFYSRLERLALKLPDRTTGARALNILRGQAPAEEIALTGIDKFLSSKEKVTRDEVVEFLGTHGYRVVDAVLREQHHGADGPQDVTLHEDGYTSAAASAEDLGVEGDVEDSDEVFQHETYDYTDSILDLRWTVSGSEDLGDWTAKGESSENEHLVETFTSRSAAERAIQAWVFQLANEQFDADGLTQYDDPGYRLPGGTDYLEHLVETNDETVGFEGKHFGGHSNVIGWYRATTRMSPDGQKVFFLEEVQSDWHQEGAKNGYFDADAERRQEEAIKAAQAPWIERREAAINAAREESKLYNGGHPATGVIQQGDGYRAVLYSWNGEMEPYDMQQRPSDLERARWYERAALTRFLKGQRADLWQNYQDGALASVNRIEAVIADYKYAQDKVEEAYTAALAPFKRMVVDGPFKTTWPELVAKRAILHAAKTGHDAIAWTTGAQQISRWESNLRQNVERIVVNPVVSSGHLVRVRAFQPGSEVSTFDREILLNGSTTVGGQEVPSLDDVIGTRLAEQVRAAPDKHHDFTGDSLSIGGGGMRDFYDRRLRDVLRKLTGTTPSTTIIQHEERTGRLSVVRAVRSVKEEGYWDVELSDGHILGIGAASPSAAMSAARSRFLPPTPVPSVPIDAAKVLEQGFPRFALQQTNTPEFRAWFGDSKVVDESGNPRVVYHGTGSRFTKFKASNNPDSYFGAGGIYFTSDPHYAADYADMHMSGMAIVPAFLSLKNPYMYTGYDEHGAPIEEPPKLAEWAKDHGYDGIIYDDFIFVAFEPGQIKSATGNRGTFNPDKADIRFALPVQPKKRLPPMTKTRIADVIASFGAANPDQTARTSAQDNVRDFHGGVRSVRTQNLPIAERSAAYSQANAAIARDAQGLRDTLLDKIRNRGQFEPWEDVALSLLADRAAEISFRAPTLDNIKEAIRLRWVYEDVRRLTAIRLGVVRDAFKETLTGAQMFADVVTTGNTRTRRKLEKIRQRLDEMDLPDEVRFALQSKMDELVAEEAKTTAKVISKLRAVGLDPALVTLDYFADPIAFSRAARIASTTKASARDKFLEWRVAAMLMGPLTNVVNLTGNTTHLVYDQVVRRLAEAMVNVTHPNPNAAQLDEFVPYFRAWLPGLAQAGHNFLMALRTEIPTMEKGLAQAGVPIGAFSIQADALEAGHQAIGGTLGRLLRLPSTTMLLAVDEFFKTLTYHTQATALAHRIAKEEGLRGDARQRRMGELLSDPSAGLHIESWRTAKRVTFQDIEGSKVLPAIISMRRAIDDVARFPVGSVLLPFVKTPYRIFQRGLALPFGPAVAIHRALTGRWSEKPGSSRADIADSVLGAGLALAIMWMVRGRDDKDPPLLTGSPDSDYAMRGLQEMTYPPSSYLSNGSYKSFARIQPLGVATTTMVDIANAMREKEREGLGAEVESMFGALANSVLENFKDMTFARTWSDLSKVIQDAQSGSGGRTAQFLRSTFLTVMVPNGIRAPLRALEPTVGATTVRPQDDASPWEQAVKTLPYELLPIPEWAPPPRYAYFGQPRLKAGRSYGARLLDPAPTNSELEDVSPLDRAIALYNDRVARGEFEGAKPFKPSAPDWDYQLDKVRHYWSPEDYARLEREGGLMAAGILLNDKTLDLENPGPEEMKKFGAAMSRARRTIRDRILSERKGVK